MKFFNRIIPQKYLKHCHQIGKLWTVSLTAGWLLIISAIFQPPLIWAQSANGESFLGQITDIVESGQEITDQGQMTYQRLKIKITNGSQAGQTTEILHQISDQAVDVSQPAQLFQVGDQIQVDQYFNSAGELDYQTLTYAKTPAIKLLGLLFVIIVLIIGQLSGGLSLVGLSLSFLVIFYIVLPLITAGWSPITAVLLGSTIIIPASFYLAHGFNLKTHLGLMATSLGLGISALLANIFVASAHLTGYGSEEATFLITELDQPINAQKLLLAGMMISSLGVLDDISIGQIAVVDQLHQLNPQLKLRELFQRGMKVGRDHITSMVNTLILVYAGGSLPLLLLFLDNQKSLTQVLELEIVASEIIQMLVGSLALVLTAPVATLLAAGIFTRQRTDQKKPLRLAKKP